jgi:hypothetical protein
MAMCRRFAGIWAGTEWQSVAARLQCRATSPRGADWKDRVERPRGRSANGEKVGVGFGGLVLCSATERAPVSEVTSHRSWSRSDHRDRSSASSPATKGEGLQMLVWFFLVEVMAFLTMRFSR